MLRRSAISLAVGMCFIGAAWAAESGGLRIKITGAEGKPVAGATVKISSPSSLVTKTAMTEADGSVRVAGLDPASDYKVEVVAPGYSAFSAADVVVVSGQNLSLAYPLGNDNVQRVVVTSSRLAQVDATSATVGTILNLGVVESLPTSRSYQGYLQLVPGVKPSAGGNPSSKSGVNYADIGGATGTSSDNVYILDGVDVTDSNTGTFGSNINSEIIQEQQILTGGIPAEYAGGSGLVSKVITKSGSDELHGSINYYFQNDSLVAKNKNKTSSGFSTYDAAVTLGGPIIKEKLWFFTSYQKKSRDTDVTDVTTGAPLRTVSRNEKLGFAKLTWQPTENDRLVASFFNDPTVISGSTTPTTLNNRDQKQIQGGDNYKVDYTRDMGNLRVNVYAFNHEGQVSTYAADLSTRNDIAFRNASPSPTTAQRSQGGLGSALASSRNRDEIGVSGEYFLETASMGSHTIKAGFSKSNNEYLEDSIVTGPEKARYSSIAAANAGVTFAEFVAAGAGWTGTRGLVVGDVPRFQNAINNSADKAYYLGLLDTDRNGTVSPAEINAYKFASTTGNPTGQVNNYRIREVQAAPYSVKATGKTFYLQDTWTNKKLTVNAGVRAEEWAHFDSKNEQSAKFKWKLAPRLSTVYDLAGDGRSKVWAFVGRYYDPVRTNMSDFAGNLTGPILDEQVHLGDKWLTFRTRGGPQTPDGLIAPTTKTPYTDEFMLGWATSLGKDYTLSAAYTKRATRDILEDYDLELYSDPSLTVATAPHGSAAPGSAYYLPYSYFGYSAKPNSNYVIGTLAGGKRDYQGVEVSLTKAKRDNWQGAASYSWNDAKGNTNSDSNADFQGDWVALDPRAPNAYGPQPGNIKHQVKGYGSYFFNNGIELSGVFNWNSGVLYSRTQLISGRNLPVMDAEYLNGGVIDTFISPGSVGSQTAPAYYTVDVRLKYVYKMTGSQKVEFFFDVFNLLDKQSATSEMPLVAGSGAFKFGQANAWVEPRRLYVGARYSF
ncbi:carboxypeptidase regulatory-like domain-containing protein [Massilia psychrophila]|uniref:carboxypeptidase regulatory-like domain-containing protein n=1 Tax=Massilia psychrophila TaxID=1603353 RepID=UPI00166A9790|nr:carboxypeptidase regulatory-like domain-containing protein [Massilia psychrophila]